MKQISMIIKSEKVYDELYQFNNDISIETADGGKRLIVSKLVSDSYDADAQRRLADEIINDIDEHVKEYKCLPEAICVVVWHNELAKETTEAILINEDKEDEDCDYIYRTSSKEAIRELCNRLNHFTDWYITDYCGMY